MAHARDSALEPTAGKLGDFALYEPFPSGAPPPQVMALLLLSETQRPHSFLLITSHGQIKIMKKNKVISISQDRYLGRTLGMGKCPCVTLGVSILCLNNVPGPSFPPPLEYISPTTRNLLF